MPRSDETPHLRVRNCEDRPVEVHVGGRVVRLAAGEVAAVPGGGERDRAQLDELVRRRVLRIEDEPPRRARAPRATKAAKATKAGGGRSRRRPG